MLICGGEYRTPNKCHAPEYLVFSNRTIDGEQEQYEEVTLHIGKLPLCITIFKSQLLRVMYSDLQDVMYIV